MKKVIYDDESCKILEEIILDVVKENNKWIHKNKYGEREFSVPYSITRNSAEILFQFNTYGLLGLGNMYNKHYKQLLFIKLPHYLKITGLDKIFEIYKANIWGHFYIFVKNDVTDEQVLNIINLYKLKGNQW